MNPLQVYYKYESLRNRDLLQENNLRRLCFYLVAPHWDSKKNGRLMLLSQLWKIPEIDKEVEKNLQYARVRKWSQEVADEYGLPLNWGEN
jgi:hypothetical protein